MRTRLAAILSALVLLGGALPVAAGTPRFAVYGDMPYGSADTGFLEGPASEWLAGDAGVGFVIAIGDLGRPESACNDDWQAQQRVLWRTGFRKPVFLTPGDNDWTDCDRIGLSELARLDALRRIHFAVPPPFVDPAWRYRAQPGQPENAMWSADGVQFATLHVVGTSNGRREINQDDQRLALALADARDAANLAWLAETFRAARANGARAVVVAMQADLFAERRGSTVEEAALDRCLGRAAYAPVCRALAGHAAAFPGPVLLVHGDTNAACLQRVVSAPGNPVFWRLNVWGDFTAPDVAVVDVVPADPLRPFRVTGVAEGAPISMRCDY